MDLNRVAMPLHAAPAALGNSFAKPVKILERAPIIESGRVLFSF
jgi:hypothetical protein